MRVVTLCAFALFVVFATASSNRVTEFEAFERKFGRKYENEIARRGAFRNFVRNMERAEELQVLNPHATFGMNEFSDMSPEDFKKTHHNAAETYKKLQTIKLPTMEFSAGARAGVAQKQDWRPKGAVTPVKNQGQCGSCWSFSTTGGIEGQWFLAGNPLTSLSEQEFVSCDTIDSGCNGGLMDNAYQWVLGAHNGSIVTEASYPYVSGDGIVPACDMTGRKFGAQIDGFANVEKADMTAFVSDKGPLSLAVYAEPWQSYTGGIMTNCPAEQMDHGVLIVGYDDTNTPPYWIIKNSWGPGWGEEGYIRIQKGEGLCSIGNYQTSAHVAKAGPTPAPGPTSGPTPNPSPSTGSLVQKTCKDARCTDCEEVRLAQGKCISRDARSYIASCDTNAVNIKEYDSKDCSGAFREQSQPRDLCAIIFGVFDEQEFVQLTCESGPAPTTAGPNPPPAPPAPTTAAPSGGTFTQKQCTNSACTEGCQAHTFQQNTCLQLTGGGSAKAVCTTEALMLTIFPDSDSCQGGSETVPQQLNTCEQDQQGTYLENTCSASAVNAVLETRGLRRN